MRDLIRKKGLLDKFPHRTEADFYIWVSKHKNRLFQDIFVHEDAQSVLDNYLKVLSNPVQKIQGKLRRFFGLVKY